MLVLCVIVLFSLTGCESKKVLYKMRIEDLPYGNLDVLSYRYTDADGNKINILFDDVFSQPCSYYATIKDKTTTRQENYNTCSYTVKDNILTLGLYVKRMIWLNNDSDYFISDTYEYFELYGKFDKSFKQLTLDIDNKEYVLLNPVYEKMLDAHMEYALYDEETNEFFDLNGLSILEIVPDEDTLTKKLQLNLSEYKIKDGYTKHEPWIIN